MRDLYAALGARWVGYGIFLHIVLIPVTDPTLLHAWFSLSFGIEQVHGMVDLSPVEPVSLPLPPGLTIRQAGPEDRHHLVTMADVVWKTLVKAPVWGVMMPEKVDEQAAGWANLVDGTGATVWLAFQEEQVVGLQSYWPAEESIENLLIPEQCRQLYFCSGRICDFDRFKKSQILPNRSIY